MKNRPHTVHPFQSARWLRAGRWCLYFSLFILHSSLTKGQTREQLTGTWIGVHTELDTNFNCPLPTYIRLSADSSYQLGMVDGSANAKKSTWAIEGDRVRLDTIHFAPRLVNVQDNLLRIGTTFPMVFRRFSDVALDSASTYRQLNGRIWQSDNLTVYLYANGQVSLENPITRQRTAHFWRLATFGKSVFLVVSGNQYNREGGYKPLWQITNVRPNQMQAIGWNGCAVAMETFRLVRNLSPNETSQAIGFQTCSACFQPLWQTTRLSQTARQYELNQLLTTYYQPVSQKEQSGLLTIKFVVNCAGQSGLFEVKGVGEDYCPKVFDSQLTTQLLTLCRNHLAVNSFLHPGKASAEQTYDTAVSLTLRLKDGQITDILP
ncbi:hypothetical protein [Spirosoma fluviale]|uniref:Uncharacterized protein n=1 Tax=Spirosoma fluviale TaxID=1597977 RepID=A0A286GJI3_9BACT|nr:hypothetical protein [Spirosoma fluviale]SOD95279.1 hypothetical protein SAMN06269250_4803 [Spirosoma fluviale]